MAKARIPESKVALLGPSRTSYRPMIGARFSVCASRDDIARVYDDSPKDVTWITQSAYYADRLVVAVSRHRGMIKSRPAHESLLALSPPRPESVPVLHGLFELFVGAGAGYSWLPADELVSALLATDELRAELFVAVATDPVTQTVTLRRADLTAILAPYSLFLPSGTGLRPDFSRARVADFGRTVAFGEYEAAGDAILYETDPEYRRKLHAQRRETERSFGASLRRLRMQRRLTQSDFPGVAAKTVARLERGEVGKPHGRTLKILAETLAVNADDIESY